MTEDAPRYIAALHERPEQPVLRRCDCCSTPVFEWTATGMLIRAKHMGERHVSLIPWAEIEQWRQRLAA